LCHSHHSGPDDLLSRAPYELSVNAARKPLHATVLTLLYDREVPLYVAVLEHGQASGAFRISEPILSVARNFVALEDSNGLHLIGANSSPDPESVRALLHFYGRLVTGVDLGGFPPVEPGPAARNILGPE